MIKRVVVAGCREFNNYPVAKSFIDRCIKDIRQQYTLVFVSGGCRGADMLGERYAKENGFAVERYDADWDTYGKAAGPIRNRQMAEIADYIICFWDGKSRGTSSMLDIATSLDKPTKLLMI